MPLVTSNKLFSISFIARILFLASLFPMTSCTNKQDINLQFDNLIKAYIRSPDKTQDQNKIWSMFGKNKTVFIADMSNFTRITKSKGIIHFLSLIHIAHEQAGKIITQHGGKIVKFDADNIYAVFDSSEQAVRSAIAIENFFVKGNKFKQKMDQIRMSIGISAGKILLLESDFYGNAVNIASKLGEDVAKDQQILVDKHVFDSEGLGKKYNGDHEHIKISGTDINYININW